MLKTIILLILALVGLPLVAYFLDPSLTEMQWHLIKVGEGSALIVATLCFLLAELTGNCSQVDKIWSVVPIIYVWEYAHLTNYHPRFVLMAVLVTLWGVRLTYNFSRRGAYSWRFWSGEEDYRWEVLRKMPMFNAPWKWTLFNLFFISFYQNILIWLITVPAIYAHKSAITPLGTTDYLIAGILLFFLIVETTADQQQWNFQNEKHRRIKACTNTELPYSRGFAHTGLWKLMRHPNYACEQAIWITFFFFSGSGSGNWLNGSLVGAVLLVILFQGSADFSEGISNSKYDSYKDYIKSTPRFFPKFW